MTRVYTWRSLGGHKWGNLRWPSGYHLQIDFSSLECVLDDNVLLDGATYENLPVTVRHTAKVAPAPNSSYLITSLENIRPTYRRILDLSLRRILFPLIN